MYVILFYVPRFVLPEYLVNLITGIFFAVLLLKFEALPEGLIRLKYCKQFFNQKPNIMKVHLIAICLTIISQAGFGQWVSLETQTSKNLYALSFVDEDNGLAVGSGGTVILTNDGGQNWISLFITRNAEDFRSVCMVTPQLLFVGGNTLYRSDDGGNTWTNSDIQYPKSLSFTDNLNGICTGITGVFKTSDGGINWSQVVNGGTSVYEASVDFGETAIAMGNVGGFATYSAIGVRNEGNQWYSFDNFSFPNSNAWVSVHFPNPDTAYMFMNQFNNWIPSANNQFVRLTGFELISVFGDNLWVFQSEVINDIIPDYMQSVHFINANEGFACGEKGSIYSTQNGGIDWRVDYEGSTILYRMQFVNNSVAYAVGNDGLMLKREITTGTESNDTFNETHVFPNPACEVCRIFHKQGVELIEVITAAGSVVYSGKPSSGAQETLLNLSGLRSGIYFVRTTLPGKVSEVIKLVVAQ